MQLAIMHAEERDQFLILQLKKMYFKFIILKNKILFKNDKYARFYIVN